MSLLGLFRNDGKAVCQEHLQIALQGVYPGFSTFQMALNGFGCGIEVIITPVIPPGGTAAGAMTTDYFGRPLQNQYEITVRIRYKDKVWEEKRIISEDIALSLEKVLAWVKSVRIKAAAISIKNLVVNKIVPYI